jgi:nitrate/TMAO reductase-like tetraheme cytochrome c subunit
VPGAYLITRPKGRWLVCLPFFLLAACSEPPPPVSATVPGEDNAAFLARHWQRPLTAQGAAPRHFSVQEAALDPAACGACHAQQYEDWRTTWHARAMGPGVLGQLLDMAPEARDEHQDCIRCHAPLAEQADGLVAAIAGKLKTGLHAEGLVCAACHVREHRRYGPPRRDGSVAKPEEKLPHDGWQASAAFADSRFCAACHQFEADGFALNGKLLENTYAEWQASPAAREGRTCQSCHMPDRRHLWRGVHDADMVKSGVVIAQEAPRFESGAVLARLTLTNSGTGHHFPTYVTPRVVAEIEQADAEGRALPGTRQEHVIARQVSPDLSREIADTRLAAGAAARLDYRAPRHPRAARLDYRVRVEPDAFYTGLYRSLLADGGAGQGRALIRQALDDSLASHFTIYEKSRSLQDGAGKP